MRRLTLACAVLALPLPAQLDGARPNYVVHEWGTFTTVTRGAGRMLKWDPLTIPSDLPTFVHDVRGRSKRSLSGTVRMETPVLYFYTPKRLELDVTVRFPKGMMSEWFPRAEVGKGRTIRWSNVEVLPGSRLEPPHDGTKSHYYPARAVDANTLRVKHGKGTDIEKFLFYRGVGTFDIPIEIRNENDRLRIRNTSRHEIGYLVYEREGDRYAYTLQTGGAGKEIVIRRPLLDAQARTGKDYRKVLERRLTAAGLYRKEAKAMVETWRDTWFEPGLRVLWMVPRSLTDRVLPLRIQPSPADVARAFVGRVEVLTARYETAVQAAAQNLMSEDPASRESAAQALSKLGSFAIPLLHQLYRKRKDPQLRVAVFRYLADAERRRRSRKPTKSSNRSRPGAAGSR